MQLEMRLLSRANISAMPRRQRYKLHGNISKEVASSVAFFFKITHFKKQQEQLPLRKHLKRLSIC